MSLKNIADVTTYSETQHFYSNHNMTTRQKQNQGEMIPSPSEDR